MDQLRKGIGFQKILIADFKFSMLLSELHNNILLWTVNFTIINFAVHCMWLCYFAIAFINNLLART